MNLHSCGFFGITEESSGEGDPPRSTLYASSWAHRYAIVHVQWDKMALRFRTFWGSAEQRHRPPEIDDRNRSNSIVNIAKSPFDSQPISSHPKGA